MANQSATKEHEYRSALLERLLDQGHYERAMRLAGQMLLDLPYDKQWAVGQSILKKYRRLRNGGQTS